MAGPVPPGGTGLGTTTRLHFAFSNTKSYCGSEGEPLAAPGRDQEGEP
jgi:hypothetical protein